MAAPAFRGLRRDIALILSDERRRTLYETAKALGRRSGDIQRVMRQMHQEKILDADSAEPTQGTSYWLSENWTAVLMDEIAEGVIPGVLADHQRLLVVTASDPGKFYDLLGKKHLAGVVAWAAELGGDGEWLVALDPKTQKVQADRLVIALKAVGFECGTLRVQSVLDSAALRQLCLSADEVVEHE